MNDLAISLPTDTTTFTASSMLPVGLVDDHHLLVLADDVSPDEVESLAVSLDPQAGWVGASRLQLTPGAELQGPWRLDVQIRRLLRLPEWVSQVMLLHCRAQRSGPLPPELTGVDPLSDAFPLGQPEGLELVALTRLRAIARRLAGGLRLAAPGPDGENHATLVVPDPQSSVDLTVYSPLWLDPDGAQAVLSAVAPSIRAVMDVVPVEGPTGLATLTPEALERVASTLGADRLDDAWRKAQDARAAAGRAEMEARRSGQPLTQVLDGYALATPVEEGHDDWGSVEVRIGEAQSLPLAVTGEPWARGGVVQYFLRWRPRDASEAYRPPSSRSRRRERARARDLIEELVVAILGAVNGVAADEDDFLVDLGVGQAS